MVKHVVLLVICLYSWSSFAQQWRTEAISSIDQQYIIKQIDTIDDLARRYLGRQLNGTNSNDLQVLQLLLDKSIVKNDQIRQLQAMGIILGSLLKKQYGLNWIIYVDKVGRSRALHLQGINEFIFPATQISRLAKVGINVNVVKAYEELEKAVVDIRNKPPFF